MSTSTIKRNHQEKFEENKSEEEYLPSHGQVSDIESNHEQVSDEQPSHKEVLDSM